jgi:hypothetical protein
MTPEDYVDTYLNLSCWIGDVVTTGRVRNYLQNGKAPQSPRAKVAHAALLAETAKMAGLGKGQTLPAVFTVNGDKYVKTSLQRVFEGKGAPDEIQDVVWLAALAGLVDETSLATYLDSNLGIDCGGFVANYWGLAHPTINNPNPNGATGFLPRTIWNTYRSHRASASAIQVGDAAVFFKDVKSNNPDIVATKKSDGTYDTSTGSQAFHIGLVASKNVMPDGTMTLAIAESSGATATSRGNGVNVRSLGTVRMTVANGLVYCGDGANRIYFTAAPAGASPAMPQW